MKTIHFCPCCGRCIGESMSSDDTSQTKVLTNEPMRIKKKQFVIKTTCKKCKSQLYVSLEFVG